MWCHPSDQKTRQPSLSPNRDVNAVFLAKTSTVPQPGAALIWSLAGILSTHWLPFSRNPSLCENQQYVCRQENVAGASIDIRAWSKWVKFQFFGQTISLRVPLKWVPFHNIGSLAVHIKWFFILLVFAVVGCGWEQDADSLFFLLRGVKWIL